MPSRAELFAEALTCYTRATEIDPSNEEAWLARANILHELGRLEEAANSYWHVVRINPKNEQAWFRRGLVLDELGRRGSAADPDAGTPPEDIFLTPTEITEPLPPEATLTSLNSEVRVYNSSEPSLTEAELRLALLYELPLKFGEETRLDTLLQLIVERVVDVIPGAVRGALFIKDRRTDDLRLKHALPIDNPSLSTTLAQKAMKRREAFIWPANKAVKDDINAVPDSAVAHQIESAIYAPLLWKGDVLGIVCVDNCETCSAFKSDDLRLLQAIAHHAAMGVGQMQLQEDLREETRILNKYVKLVSPQLAERLKEYRAPIRLGGDFIQATILFSDIRGFTEMSEKLEATEVTEMLEDYFSRLVPIVFKHLGTVDKFVGDAIVAVFGSPREDSEKHINAIRTALEMQDAMEQVNASRNAEGKYTVELGIGIHCGEVVHGFIGSRERMEYTVIGDAVNRASRYCDGARRGEVLISREMYELVFRSVEAEETHVPFKHEGVVQAFRIRKLKDV